VALRQRLRLLPLPGGKVGVLDRQLGQRRGKVVQEGAVENGELGNPAQLLILKKPLDTVEVLQLAASLTHMWNFAERARRASDLAARRNLEMIEWLDQPLIAIDSHKTVTRASAAVAALLGGSTRDFVGKSLCEAICDPDSKGCAGACSEIAAAATSECEQPMQAMFVTRDGDAIEIELFITPVRDEKGEHAGAAVVFRRGVDSRS
jgi:PAS domain S-box-containing protein